MLGATSTKKRGKTLCLKINARKLEERQEITLDELGEPIGPDDKIVSEFTSFLGTIGRSPDFCPLNYTSWKALDKEPMWDYVNVLTYPSEYIYVCVLSYMNELYISK